MSYNDIGKVVCTGGLPLFIEHNDILPTAIGKEQSPERHWPESKTSVLRGVHANAKFSFQQQRLAGNVP